MVPADKLGVVIPITNKCEAQDNNYLCCEGGIRGSSNLLALHGHDYLSNPAHAHISTKTDEATLPPALAPRVLDQPVLQTSGIVSAVTNNLMEDAYAPCCFPHRDRMIRLLAMVASSKDASFVLLERSLRGNTGSKIVSIFLLFCKTLSSQLHAWPPGLS